MATFEEMFLQRHIVCSVIRARTQSLTIPFVINADPRRVRLMVMNNPQLGQVMAPREGNVSGVPGIVMLGTMAQTFGGSSGVDPTAAGSWVIYTGPTVEISIWQWIIEKPLEDLYRDFLKWKKGIEEDGNQSDAGTVEEFGQDPEGPTRFEDGY